MTRKRIQNQLMRDTSSGNDDNDNKGSDRNGPGTESGSLSGSDDNDNDFGEDDNNPGKNIPLQVSVMDKLTALRV